MITALLSTLLISASVTVAWDVSLDTTVTGYKIYIGTTSRSYSKFNDVGKTMKYQITGLSSGTNYFITATAYNTQAIESDFSNEVMAAVPSIPLNIKITPDAITSSVVPGGAFTLQKTSDFNTWATASQFTATSNTQTTVTSMNKPAEFFRLKADSLPPMPKAVTALTATPAKFNLFASYRPGHHPDYQKGAEKLVKH